MKHLPPEVKSGASSDFTFGDCRVRAQRLEPAYQKEPGQAGVSVVVFVRAATIAAGKSLSTCPARGSDYRRLLGGGQGWGQIRQPIGVHISGVCDSYCIARSLYTTGQARNFGTRMAGESGWDRCGGFTLSSGLLIGACSLDLEQSELRIVGA